MIGTVASISLPGSIYTAIIITINMTLALSFTMKDPADTVFKLIPMTLQKLTFLMLLFITSLVNIWAVYQTLTFYNGNFHYIFYVLGYFLAYYAVTVIIVSPDTVRKIISFKKLTNLFTFTSSKKEEVNVNDISVKDEILRLLKYKKANRESFTILKNDETLGIFTIKDITNTQVVIDAEDSLRDALMKNPLDKIIIKMTLPTDSYTIKSVISSMSPLSFEIPKILFHAEKYTNNRSDFRISHPRKISAAINKEKTKIEISIEDISAGGMSFLTSSENVINLFDNTNTYIDVSVILGTDILEIESSVANKKEIGDEIQYGLKFHNVNDSYKKQIQQAIFREIDN